MYLMAKSKSATIYHQRPFVVLSTNLDRQPSYSAFISIAQKAREYGWELFDLRFTRGTLPDHRKISGAIVGCLPTDPIVKQLLRLECPVVRIGQFPHPQDHIIPAVLPDLAASWRLAAEHFAERGIRHIGYVARTPWGAFKPYYEAYHARAEELGCTCNLLRLPKYSSKNADLRYEQKALQIGEWLTQLPRPAGILAFSDTEAATISTVCRKVNLGVPEDVAVLGVGNNTLNCEMAPVPLSSIDQAMDSYGTAAVNLLKQLMDGYPPPVKPIMIQPKGIVTRRSTDILAVKDPKVARAIRFIWDHFNKDLSVDDVADHVNAGRRQLERAFKAHVGHGIAAELRRKRLERCCELLRTSDARISDIAIEVGFKSSDHLHLAFRKTYGITPRQYRISGN